MKNKCEVDGCDSPTYSDGGRWSSRPFALSTRYCRKHLRWLEQYGTLEPPKNAHGSLEFKFWKHTEKRGDDECWEWKADLSRSGYGSLWNPETKKNISAVRFSCELHHGKPADGMFVLHACDNKRCVNPAHIRWGTAGENTKEAIERGLRPRCAIPVKSGEQNPKSKLTLEQVRFIRKHPEMQHKQLADLFGLSPNCIRGVRTGRTWKGIE